MTITTRFLTGSMASVAVASAVTLAGPAAYAADGPARACGQAAVPALHTAASPVLVRVPAETHLVWRWEHEVTTVEHEYARVITPLGSTVVDVTREVDGVTEYLWSHRVVTQPAVPAVPATPAVGHVEIVVVTPEVTVTQFEYVQRERPDMTRWEDDGWNGDKGDADKGQGWTRTGDSRPRVVSPAVTEEVEVVTQEATAGSPVVPEVSHVEETWASMPEGSHWTRVQRSVPAPEVVDTVWAVDRPDGYDPTGRTRSHTSSEQTDTATATAPGGEGWTKVPGSEVVVIDREETTLVIGGVEPMLVTPGMPASPACPQPAPAGLETVPVTAAGPATGTAAAAATGAHAAATTAVDPAAASDAANHLPNTGNPVSPLLLGTGLGALLAGGALVRVGRRREAS